MFSRQLLISMCFILLLLPGCSSAIDLPAPEEFNVKLVGAGAPGEVEASWKLVLRVDAYLLSYSETAGGPYDGKGLSYMKWTGGCVIPEDESLTTYANGDGSVDALFDGGTQDGQGIVDSGGTVEAGPQDSGASDLPPKKPGLDADSPIRIPASWCLSLEETYSDAGPQPSETPGRRPKLRLQHLQAGKTYFFRVQALRNELEGVLSPEVSVQIPEPGQ